MQKIILFSLTTLFLITSCKNQDEPLIEEENTTVEEVIFGSVSGFCQGSCRSLYRLDSGGLYEDLETPPTTAYEDTPFSTTSLSAAEYDLAASLLEVPRGLLETDLEIEEQVIADMDFYLRVKTTTGVKSWIWDDISEEAQSNWLEYFDQVRATLIELRK